jgi:hypothetical protein
LSKLGEIVIYRDYARDYPAIVTRENPTDLTVFREEGQLFLAGVEKGSGLGCWRHRGAFVVNMPEGAPHTQAAVAAQMAGRAEEYLDADTAVAVWPDGDHLTVKGEWGGLSVVAYADCPQDLLFATGSSSVMHRPEPPAEQITIAQIPAGQDRVEPGFLPDQGIVIATWPDGSWKVVYGSADVKVIQAEPQPPARAGSLSGAEREAISDCISIADRLAGSYGVYGGVEVAEASRLAKQALGRLETSDEAASADDLAKAFLDRYGRQRQSIDHQVLVEWFEAALTGDGPPRAR